MYRLKKIEIIRLGKDGNRLETMWTKFNEPGLHPYFCTKKENVKETIIEGTPLIIYIIQMCDG